MMRGKRLSLGLRTALGIFIVTLLVTSTWAATEKKLYNFGISKTSKQSLYGRWSAKNISTTVPNALLPSDHDSETDRNLILSHNYAITNTLVNEARFGVSLFRIGVQFPIEGASAIQQLGLVGLNLSDHPTTSGSWLVFSHAAVIFGEGLRAHTMYALHNSSTFTANG